MLTLQSDDHQIFVDDCTVHAINTYLPCESPLPSLLWLREVTLEWINITMPRPHTHTRRIWCWHFLSHTVAAWASVVLLLDKFWELKSDCRSFTEHIILWTELDRENFSYRLSKGTLPSQAFVNHCMQSQHIHWVVMNVIVTFALITDCILYWGSVGASSHQKLTGSVWMTLFDLGTSSPKTWLYHFEDNAMSKDNTWKIAKWKVHLSWQLSRNQLQYYKKQV